MNPIARMDAADDCPGTDYHGRPTHRLVGEHLWVEVLATAGPRIIRLGLAGSTRNLLAETPDSGWETPSGRYELFGGHRLWFAPEDPDRVAVPDGHGLDVEMFPDGIRLTGMAEAPTGLVRSMALRLEPGRALMEVRHELRNIGTRTIELAPWAITQLPLGGTVVLPQRVATPGHHVHPNRMLVLWPYTSWEDPRFHPRDGLITVEAKAGPNLKLGYFNDAGWVAYANDGAVLIRRFEPRIGQSHPDLGCNVEVFIGGRFLELETLGPLTALAPDASVALVEHWEVVAADPAIDGFDIRAIADRADHAAATGALAAVPRPIARPIPAPSVHGQAS